MIVHRERATHAIIDSSVLADTRLSWAARGVLAFLRTHPGGEDMMTAHLGHASSEERLEVQEALRQLKAIGYITFKVEVES